MISSALIGSGLLKGLNLNSFLSFLFKKPVYLFLSMLTGIELLPAIGLLVLLAIIFWLFLQWKATKRELANIIIQQKEAVNNDAAKLADLKKLFSIISHDVRGPIGTQSIFFKSVEKGQLTPDDVLSQIQHLTDSSSNLYRTLDIAMLWWQSKYDKLVLNTQVYNSTALFQKILADASPLLLAKKIDLKTSIESIDFNADITTLQQAIKQILHNAIKYSHPQTEVLINLSKQQNKAKLVIKDFGVGMNKSLLSDVIQQQNTKSQRGTLGERGLGVGLQLACKYLMLNNCSIQIESVETKGTTITILLPLQEA